MRLLATGLDSAGLEVSCDCCSPPRLACRLPSACHVVWKVGEARQDRGTQVMKCRAFLVDPRGRNVILERYL